MVQPNVDYISIELPASLGAAVSDLKLAILPQRNGGRALTRSLRDANASDAGRIRRVEWEFWGPIGASLFSTSGRLGVDLCANMETRWERRLLPATRQDFLSLTGFDPPGTGAYFGTAYFGSSYFGSGLSGSGGTPGDVSVFDQQPGTAQLFAARGEIDTQIDITSKPFSVVDSVVFDAVIRDADDWYGNGYLALGPSIAMQRRVGATELGATYEDTVSTSPSGDVFANAIKVGSDRAWIIDAAATTATYNFAGYTLDAFENMAAPFQVGDPKQPMNGIGPYGPLTLFGQSNGIFSFTDQGKPVPLSRGLINLRSDLNGKQFADPGFGWAYYTSITGLRCVNLQGDDNPVGVGERMRGFTGHSGIPSAIWAARGELWIVYNDEGNIYAYRGVFGPETAGTGQPLMFPWFYEASQTCNAVYASATPNAGTQNLTIFRGDGTDMDSMTIAANGRDDLAATAYDVEPGAAYLTTFDKDTNLLKTHRLFRTRARNMNAGDTFTIGLAFDADPVAPTTATYTTVGTITSDGFKTLISDTGVVDGQGNPTPTLNISGRTAKPRITKTSTLVYENIATNPSAESGVTTGWSGAGLGVSVRIESVLPALYGDLSFAGVAGVAGVCQWNGTVTTEYNTTYCLNLGVYVPSGAGASALDVNFVLFGTTGDISSPVNLALTNQWQTIQVGPFTTPATGSHTAIISVAGTVAAALRYVLFDGLCVTEGSEQVPYFDGGYSSEDGNGNGTRWLGTANLSASTWYPSGDTPPELDGTLEWEYDERPEQIEVIEFDAMVETAGFSDNQVWQWLQDLSGSRTDGPFRVQIPDDLTPAVDGASGGGQGYAMLQSVTQRKDASGNVEGVHLVLERWPQASAFSR